MKDDACQLLTAIDDGEAAAAKLLDDNYAAQQKFDGKRTILAVDRSSITAHNRSGLVCEISRHILDQAKQLQGIAPPNQGIPCLRSARSRRNRHKATSVL